MVMTAVDAATATLDGLPVDLLLEMYAAMLRARRLDERCWILHRQGKIAFHISGIGHEGTQVGAAFALKKGYDFVHPYYRDMALSLTLCALVYAPFAAAEWPSALPSPNALASVVTLAVVCTAAAFLLFAALIDEVGPVRATVITYVNPAVAAVLGVLVLGETFTVGMAAGFLLVILGSTLATRPARATGQPAADS